MFKFIIVSVLVFGLTLQACGNGCLKCNTKNECIFCDMSNAYILSNSTCAVSTLTNCKVLGGNGDCAQCADAYYLDTSTKKCVAVDTTKVVKNCSYYGAGSTCLLCVKNYFISAGQCTAVTKTVDNCDIYSDDGKCAACAQDFIFNLNRDACIAKPKVSNCAAYSFLDCKSCAAGYILNPNLYFAAYQLNSANILSEIKTFTSGGYNDWTNPSRCQKIQAANCAVASSYNTCATCMPGYFLAADKTCRQNPKPIIEGCAIYNSLTSCTSCQNNYYLESATKCTLITSDKFITDCLSYSTTVNSVQCTKCVDSKYLNNNNCVSARSASLNIANCKTVAIDADVCTVCNDGYILTTDGKKCWIVIQNCKEYNNLSSSSNATCKTCADTYYLVTVDLNTYCAPGNIEGCLGYSSSNTCTACNPSAYYLSNSKCVRHLSIGNCVTYSGSNFNTCAICAAGYFPFTYSSTCSAITVIQNCIAYSDATTCSACADGFFLKANICVSIAATFTNCKSAPNAATSCGNCVDGYALKSVTDDKTCALNHNYITDQCATQGSNILFKAANVKDSDSCSACKENSFPKDLSGLFVCISDSLLNTKGISNLVLGCKQYSNDASPVCLQCSTYLNIPANGARTCVSTCDPASNTFIADNLDGHINTCASNASNGNFSIQSCASAIKVYISNSVSLQCTKFSSAKATVALTSIPADNASYWKDIEDSTVPRPAGSFLYFGYPVTSSVNGDTDAHDNENDSKKSCELYWRIAGTTTLYCYRCKWGYTSKHFTPNGGSLKTQCLLIDGCDTTVSYSGFSAQLNQVLSCNACTNNKYVTVFLGTSTDDNSLNISGLAREKTTIQCLPTSVGGSESNPKAVDGCLIYGWIYTITNPSSPSAPTNAKGCIACKPGYTLSAYFGICTAISSCSKSTNNLVNRCSVCSQTTTTGLIEYKAFKDYKADTCYLVKSANCLFADSVADANGKYDCRVCNPGYWLNHDKQCEKNVFSQCSDNSGAATTTYTYPVFNSLDKLVEYYALKSLSLQNTITGCDKCNSGFTAVRAPQDEVQCVSNSYVLNNSYVTTAPMKYVTDCIKYSNNVNASASPVATCSTCKGSLIVTFNGSQCVAPIANCLIAQNSEITKCNVCADTHVQIAGVCVIKNINNCKTYNQNSNVADLLCTGCADGFVLASDSKSCYAGNVTGCKAYGVDAPWNCLTCFSSFNLVNTANSKTYCIKVDEGSNCSALETSLANGLQGGFYKCNSCAMNNVNAYIPKAYATNDNTFIQSVCLKLNSVDKCVSYAPNQSSIATSSFLCTACDTGFYIDETKNLCVARKVMPAKCSLYYANKDKCQTCGTKTFKNPDETDCIDFPNGILRCGVYYNENVCTSCISPAYLDGNACPLSNVITNCATYSANNTCSSCASGFFLSNSTSCVQAQASNCYTYSAINACASCDPNDNTKGLKTDENGVTNCVDKGLQNCEVSTNNAPFTCSKCKSGYYLGADGNCALVNTPITKCLSYDNDQSCISCEQGAVLAVDRKSCNTTAYTAFNDGNCLNSQLLSDPSCSKCSPGSVFVNNTCTSCSNSTFDNGCFSCDPENQSSCFACRPGYYQNTNGTCISPIVPYTNNTANNTNNTSSAMITQLIGLLILLYSLLL